MTNKESLIAFVSSEGRVCPLPQEWMMLSKIIGKNAPGHRLAPLILAGWEFSSDAQKRERLIAQIEYAHCQSVDVANEFSRLLYSFDDVQWHKGSEPPSSKSWEGM